MTPPAAPHDIGGATGSGVADGGVADGGVTGGVVGLGTDLTDVDALRRALERRPGLRRRLFTDAEWEYSDRHRDPLPHLAGRFAAKEAVMKCLGAGIGRVGFTEIEVGHDDSGAPTVSLSGRAAERAAALGVARWLVSLTHTSTLAQSVALAVAAADRVPDALPDTAPDTRPRRAVDR